MVINNPLIFWRRTRQVWLLVWRGRQPQLGRPDHRDMVTAIFPSLRRAMGVNLYFRASAFRNSPRQLERPEWGAMRKGSLVRHSEERFSISFKRARTRMACSARIPQVMSWPPSEPATAATASAGLKPSARAR